MMPHTLMLRKKIKLITLDLDNTVWPNNKVIVEAEKAMWDFVFTKYPEIYNDYDDKRISEIRVTLVEKNPNLKFDLTTFRKEIIKHILQEVGADESEATYYSNEAFNEFFKSRNKVQLYKDAKIIIERLFRKTKVASLSNGNADLKLIGIDHVFDFSINSKDVQSNKPSPDHFLKALELTKCEADEVIHIGDCPINDVGGARNCNFNTIWFNSEGGKWTEIFPCELQAKNWKEVYNLINKNFILERENV